MKSAVRASLAIVLAFWGTTARAEVADKMLNIDPTIDPLVWPAVLCCIALALEFRWPRSGLLTIPLTALLAWGTYLEFADPYVGPAILRELGQSYIITSWLALGFALVFPVALTIGMSRQRARG